MFWYDNWRPKCREKTKLYYINTGSFIVYGKRKDKIWSKFDPSNYILDGVLPKGKKRVIGLMIDKIGEKIFTEFGALWPKTYSHQTNDSDVIKIKKQKA